MLSEKTPLFPGKLHDLVKFSGVLKTSLISENFQNIFKIVG